MNKVHCALSYDDCSIRVYRSFTTNFHKCLILLLTLILQPIMISIVVFMDVSAIHMIDQLMGLQALMNVGYICTHHKI